jgi:cell division septal protein FtsQ
MAKRIGANKRKLLSERKVKGRKKKGPVLKRIMLLLVIAGVLSAVGAGAVFGSVRLGAFFGSMKALTIGHIRVQGVMYVDSARIVAQSELAVGQPMLRFKSGEACKRIETLPRVEKARVRRQFPSTVTIVIKERAPFAAVAGPTLRLVDKNGALFAPARGEYIAVPLIAGLENTVASDGTMRLTEESVQKLSRLFEQLKKASPAFAGEITQYRFFGSDHVAVFFAHRNTIARMALSRVPESMARLATIFEAEGASAKTPRRIDLCYGNLAFVN